LSPKNQFTYICDSSGIRVDAWVSQQSGEPRKRVKESILDGNLLVNGVKVKPSFKMKGGETVEFTPPPIPLTTAIPEDIKLNIVHMDDYLIIVDKEPGMVVHPAPGHYSGTMVNALLGMGVFKTVGGDLRPGIVHRIDKLTSGLLVVARTKEARDGLVEQFKIHSITREYIAIISGAMTKSKGTFDTLHGRHPTNRLKFSSKVIKGKKAKTYYKTIEKYGTLASLVKVTLSTGRTHQVRVHFCDAGHPLLGDPLYRIGGLKEKTADAGKLLGRQALHAAHLGFIHPVTGKQMSFNSPLPEDMENTIAFLKESSDEQS
jgi:23S rRNA pseudouridine1911/1915/1917 synthase